MRVRTTVAAGVLAAAASLPLAGVALAHDKGCPDFHSQAEAGADKKVPNGIDGIVCETLGADKSDDKSNDKSKDKSKEDSVAEGDGGAGDKGSADGVDGDHGGDGGPDYGADKAEGADAKSADAKSKDGSAERADVADGGEDDSGPAPVGGVETGAGGTAGDDFEPLVPLGLAGGAALAAGGMVLVRRRLAGPAERPTQDN